MRYRYYVEIYSEPNGDHHWRMMTRNGRNVANPGEGYKRKGHCAAQVKKLFGPNPQVDPKVRYVERTSAAEKRKSSTRKPSRYVAPDGNSES